MDVMKKLILSFIRFYQKTAFFHGYFFRMFYMSDKMCRFEPSCSIYTYEAVEKYGVGRGTLLGLKRIIRCNPWNKGGLDPLR